jgi:hypothetical protein
VVWDKILFEAKAVEMLTEAHVKQVLNYLPAKPRFKRGFFCFPAGRVARNGYDLEIEV